MKIELAIVVDKIEVRGPNATIEQIGKPISISTIQGEFPEGGATIELPVVIFFSTEAELGLRDFVFSYVVRDPDGDSLGGRQTHVQAGIEPLDEWPSDHPYPLPISRMVTLFAAKPGAYEIEIWINDHRDEGVRLLHLVAVA